MSLKSGSNISDWDNFWSTNKRDVLERLDDPQNWEDIVWKTGLAFWNNVFFNFNEGSNFLECGAGSAASSRFFLKNRNYNISIIDSSKQSLQLAEHFLKKNSQSAEIVQGDIRELPFESESFDIVYMAGVIEFIHDYEKVIKESYRVLKKGGILGLNIVPRKISIQTLGDIQMTIAHSLRSLINMQYNEIKIIKNIPSRYNLNTAHANDYINALNKFNFKNVNKRYLNGFPNLSLPQYLKSKYINYLKNRTDRIIELNQKDKLLNRLLGISLAIYGTK